MSGHIPTSASAKPSDVSAQKAIDKEDTGLPALRTWRVVYFMVMGIFVLWVALLFALPRIFS